jgi:TIR domain-containing protein
MNALPILRISPYDRSITPGVGGVREVASNADPLFFLSYAHSPGDQVTRFFEDLSEMLAQLVDLKAGAEPGFMDTSISGGRRWSGELLSAVGTCQVFLPLLSRPYLASEWCGMEWYAFAERAVVARADGSDHETAIVPVIWAPLPDEAKMPSAVSAIQRFTPGDLPDPTIARLYQDEGVFGLTMVKKDAYEPVVWRLAQRIADITHKYVVEPRVLKPTELRDIFQEADP